MSLSRAPERRARLSMTSLIDVIFLLLLFFMLSSTFSKFAKIELTASGTTSAPVQSDAKLYFLRLSDARITLNAQEISNAALPAELQEVDGPKTVIISVTRDATAQLLTDVLVALRKVPNTSISVLGGT